VNKEQAREYFIKKLGYDVGEDTFFMYEDEEDIPKWLLDIAIEEIKEELKEKFLNRLKN